MASTPLAFLASPQGIELAAGLSAAVIGILKIGRTVRVKACAMVVFGAAGFSAAHFLPGLMGGVAQPPGMMKPADLVSMATAPAGTTPVAAPPATTLPTVVTAAPPIAASAPP